MIFLDSIKNTPIFRSELLAKETWLEHAFSTRIGGISKGIYESLNIYSIKEEEKNNTLKNREKLAYLLEFNSNKLVLAQQIHGKNVYRVVNTDAGKGMFSHIDAISETDSLITNEKDIPIMLLYADCLPILIADKENKAVAVIHAGWKGTVQKIIEETLIKMEQEFHSKKENTLIAFGVGIGKCCFEIQEDAQNKLSKVNYSEQSFEIRKNKIFADLIEINKSQAINFGIPESNIDYNKDLCTYCNKEFFYSYRRDNQVTGRHCAVIFIKGVNGGNFE